VALAAAVELEVVIAELVPLGRPNPSTLLGSGAIERLAGSARVSMKSAASCVK
jgi:GTP-binding protein HflX